MSLYNIGYKRSFLVRVKVPQRTSSEPEYIGDDSVRQGKRGGPFRAFCWFRNGGRSDPEFSLTSVEALLN